MLKQGCYIKSATSEAAAPTHSEGQRGELGAGDQAQDAAQKAGQLLQLAAVGMADNQGQEEERERTARARHGVEQIVCQTPSTRPGGRAELSCEMSLGLQMKTK